jgi:excisionase family DNA binding protein
VEERHYSLSEVARILGKSERTVRRWIKLGTLRAYKPGRDYLIPESALRELLEGSEVPKVAPPLPFEERGSSDSARRAYGGGEPAIEEMAGYVSARLENPELRRQLLDGPRSELDQALTELLEENRRLKAELVAQRRQ